ncbi:hypothetical protein L218DRAFT_63404 [Marasmius fiardii PR-910]|nr:hypothetical protein L218DRAFT_63404 [Marasmius fiardii PR-910]
MKSQLLRYSCKSPLISFWPHASNLFSILNRDAITICTTIFGALSVMTVGIHRKELVTVFVLPVLISIISCAGCRLILHLFSLGGQGAHLTDAENVTLTNIDMTVTWDTETHT